MSKETYTYEKRPIKETLSHAHISAVPSQDSGNPPEVRTNCQKRRIYMKRDLVYVKERSTKRITRKTGKETYKRDLQKRPTKETYKRDLLMLTDKRNLQKRHTKRDLRKILEIFLRYA